MKRIRLMCMAFAVSLAVQAVPEVESPSLLPDSMLSITVPNVHGLLDEVGTLAAQASPMLNGPMLKSILGMQLGDPGLAGIAPGQGLAVVMLDETNTFAVIEVAEAQSTTYSNVLAAKGLQTQFSQGVLVAAQDAKQLGRGVALAAKVQNTLLQKRSTTLRIAVQPAALIADNSEQIESLLQTLPVMLAMQQGNTPGMSPASTEGIGKLLVAELRILLSLAGQTEAVEVVLAPKAGSLRVDQIIVTKAGSRLATFCAAPRVKKWNPKLQAGFFGKGVIQIDMLTGNPAATAAFIAAETDAVLKQLELEGPRPQAIAEYMKKSTSIYGGTMCESIFASAEGGMGIGFLVEVNNEKEALAFYKSMSADLEACGFSELYKNIGMPMSMDFKENIREHKGVQIHHFAVKMDVTEMPVEQREQFEVSKLDHMGYDLAIVDGIMAFSMGGPKIEEIIDRIRDAATTPPPLKARSVYPADGFYYGDLDLAEYVAFIQSFIPESQQAPEQMQQIAAMLKGAAPITTAGFQHDGRILFSTTVPGELLSKIGQMIMQIQMQQMQQGFGAPSPLVPVQ